MSEGVETRSTVTVLASSASDGSLSFTPHTPAEAPACSAFASASAETFFSSALIASASVPAEIFFSAFTSFFAGAAFSSVFTAAVPAETADSPKNIVNRQKKVAFIIKYPVIEI